jgi:hypothetical protein
MRKGDLFASLRRHFQISTLLFRPNAERVEVMPIMHKTLPKTNRRLPREDQPTGRSPVSNTGRAGRVEFLPNDSAKVSRRENVMNIKQRLQRLEAKLCRQERTDVPVIERTDEEEADDFGTTLWLAKDVGKHCWSDSPVGAALRAWHQAAQLARHEGHTDYHTALRPAAMACWLAIKPKIREHQRSHGQWIWDDPPRRLDTMTMEEFEQLPTEQKVAALREQRRGHWSKKRDF